MGIAELAFYVFSMSTLIGGIFTVVARNPVHSVLWLIVAFFNAAGLMVLVGMVLFSGGPEGQEQPLPTLIEYAKQGKLKDGSIVIETGRVVGGGSGLNLGHLRRGVSHPVGGQGGLRVVGGNELG